MLRALVLLLALANIGFWAWTQGWLDNVSGVRARGDREPERLARQVRPETIVILPPGGNGAASAAAPAPACLEAGPFDAAGFAAAEAALGAVQPPIPAGSWTDAKTSTQGTWMVYMGRFENREALAKKEEQLKRYRNLEFQEVQHPPELEPGLSLGQFDDREQADKALAQLGERGIRTARVIESVPVITTHWLRFEAADAELTARLAALKADALGKGFAACVSGEGR